MTSIEIPWLYIIFGTGILGSGLILLEMRKINPNSSQGNLYWSYGNMIVFLGLMLFGFQAYVPDFVSVIFGPLVILIATLFYIQSLNHVLSKKINIKLGILFVSIIFVSLSISWVTGQNYALHVIIYSVGMIGIILMALLPYIPIPYKIYRLQNFLRIGGIILIGLFSYRIIYFMLNFNQGAAFFDKSPQLVIVLGFASIILILITNSFILLSNTNHLIEYRTLANTDALTQTFSRRAILEYAQQKSALYNQTKMPFSILLLDMDNLKAINDAHGHKAGDNALNLVSRLVMENLRQDDAIGRYGGDEFLIVLANSNIKGAKITADRIMTVFNNKNSTEDFASEPFMISVGVAQYSHRIATIDNLIEYADQAMYSAKENQGNSIHLADTPVSDLFLMLTNS
ncbi:MAG: GGDEF domain-containing protein [Chloroflexota bacterium]